MRAAVIAPLAFTLAACGSTAPARPLAERATILFFADAHAQLEEHPELFWDEGGRTEIVPTGGYARLAHVVRAIRQETGDRTILVDGGDTFQGSGPAAWSRGDAIVEPHRALGVDLGIPGNWEVAYGSSRMRGLLDRLGYPVLAANVTDEDGTPILPATLVRDVGGIRFGFVGLTDPDVPRRQPPAYSRGLRYLGAEAIAPHVRALREQADVIVLVAHVGLARALEIVDRVDGIDVVLSADSHERITTPIVRNGAWVVEPGAFTSFLGRLDVELVPGERPRLAWELLELRANRYPEDPRVARIVEQALAPHRAQAARVLGRARVPLERYGVVANNADDVVTDAVREATGVDVAFSNGFRFGHPIEAGPISEADLWTLLPVSTPLRVGRVTGRQLREHWEREIDHVFAEDPRRLFGGWLPRVSGMTVRFRADAPFGRRITAIEIDGRPLEDGREYSIAACEREGDDDDVLCRMRGVRGARTLEIDIHEAVRRYLARRDAVGAPSATRVTAEDLPPRVFSQYERR